VTTDFETHRLWVNQPCDHYFTATDEGACYLHSWGVPREAITVTGIPVHPVFSKAKDRPTTRQKLGLSGDRPVVLQLSGGFGVGPIAKLYEGMLAVQRPLDLVVISGRNEKLRAQLEKVPTGTRHRVRILGFTDQIDEWMAAADLVVSKPGGLTTSETLARGAIMVIVNPIPGQETRNSDFLLENGAAIKVNNAATLAYKIDSLLGNENRLRQLRQNVAGIARPRAAYQVAERALRFLPHPVTANSRGP
jgi:processive 1,2-diacylglycerol beta-glucosyltransferase